MGDAFTTVLSTVWTQITNTVTTISGNTLLLIPVAGTFAGLVIGLTQKLMGIRRRRGR